MTTKNRLIDTVTQSNPRYVTRKQVIEMIGIQYKKSIYAVSNAGLMGFPKPTPSNTAVNLYYLKRIKAWIKKTDLSSLPVCTPYKYNKGELSLLGEGKSTLDNVMAQKYIRALQVYNI
jgi:hypothetical protein